MTLLDRVPDALRALQERADPTTGELRSHSLPQIIKDKLGVTGDEANQLNEILGLLGHRKTPRGRSSPQYGKKHSINLIRRQSMSPAEIEITAKYLKLIEPAPEVTPPEEPPPLPETTMPASELIQQLTAIIHDLESQLVERDQKLRERDDAIAQAATAVEDLTNAFQGSEDRNERLTAELRESRRTMLTGKLSKDVEGILTRYGSGK